jgi:GNAT superfamily N-acetyltransferase
MKIKEVFTLLPSMSYFIEDHAIDANISIPDFNPRYAKIVGTVDGMDVWATKYFGDKYTTFAFRSDEQLISFIVVEDRKVKGSHPLVRTFCDPQYRKQGYITALVNFVTHKLRLRLILLPSERLTPDSWNWLVSAVQANRITTLNGSTKQPLTVDEILAAQQTQTPTDLSVIIETGQTKQPVFGSGVFRQLNEMILFVNDSRLD